MSESRRRAGRHHLAVGVALGVCLTLLAVLLVALVAPEAPQDAGGELVILSGRDDSAGERRQALVDQWNALNQDNKARIVELSGNADQQRNEMVKRAQAAESDVDVYNLDVTWTAEFAENDYIVPLAGPDTTGFLAAPLDTCLYERRFDGVPFSGEQLWALPFNTDAGLLYYREDLVSRPERWDTLVSETRRALAVDDRDPTLEAGYTTQLDNYEGLTVNVLEILREFDETIEVDDSGHLPFDPVTLKKAVDRLRPSADRVLLPASLGYDEQRSTQAMRDGRTLFLRNWPLAYRTLTARSEEQTGSAPRVFGVAQLPGGSVLGGQNLAVSRHSAQPEAATGLIEFLTRADSQKLLFEQGGLAPTRGSVYDDPSVRAAFPYAGELRSAVDTAVPRPEGPCYAHFSKILRDTVTNSLRTGAPLPEDFVEQLDAALNCRPAPS